MGLSQKDLAEKVGITQALLSHYETGKRSIPVEIIIQISISLNVRADLLLGTANTGTIEGHIPSRKILQTPPENRKPSAKPAEDSPQEYRYVFESRRVGGLIGFLSVADSETFSYPPFFLSSGCGSRPITVISPFSGPYTQYIRPAPLVWFSRYDCHTFIPYRRLRRRFHGSAIPDASGRSRAAPMPFQTSCTAFLRLSRSSLFSALLVRSFQSASISARLIV
jgi:transcriptional regulator with XRE-family HTH domain